MWLITNFGFFSVVEKSEQKGTGTLTVRARVLADLQQLKDRYLPGMGSIQTGGGTDYRYRAVVSRDDVAEAFRRAIADIDYANFKNSVAASQGTARSSVYHDVWDALWKLQEKEQT
jgi:hypothetical protein